MPMQQQQQQQKLEQTDPLMIGINEWWDTQNNGIIKIFEPFKKTKTWIWLTGQREVKASENLWNSSL